MTEDELRGAALDEALEAKGLSKSGTVAEKRERLAAAEAEAGEGGSTVEQDANLDAEPGSQVNPAPDAPPEGESSFRGEDPRGDAGPGTGTEAPEDASADRYPSTLLTTAAGPLAPPTDAETQAEPDTGNDRSTNDHVYASVGGQSIAGETHSGLVDGEGNALSADSIFEDADPGKTWVTTGTRVYEQFTYPNTTEVCTRLLFVEGQRVNRAEAERVKSNLSRFADA